MWTDSVYIAHRHMNVENGNEAAQFPEKEYINGIAVAVYFYLGGGSSAGLYSEAPVALEPLLALQGLDGAVDPLVEDGHGGLAPQVQR